MGYVRRLVAVLDPAWRTPPAARFGREGWIAFLLILAVWAAASLPHLSRRAFIYEEGRNAMIARDILVHGNWLEPTIFGTRWAEKPDLLSWAGVVISPFAGGVDEWSIRLPAMLSVLLTVLLIQRLTRRFASLGASLFAAGSYLFCPRLLQKLTVAEPDTLVTAFSFAAFMLWWEGEELGRVSRGRWVGCGVLLTILAMAKGPQPVAFFGLGVGLYVLYFRRWRELPGLVLALALPALATLAWGLAVYQSGDFYNWLRYMRVAGGFDLGHYLFERLRFVVSLALEWLPSTLLLPLMALPSWRRKVPLLNAPISAALICYAAGGMAALLLWPGVGSRYAMPVTPAIVILAAFVAEALWREGRRVAQAATGVLAALCLYQLVLTNLGVPIFAGRFALSRTTGEAITQVIRANPAPVYCLISCEPTRLFYVEAPIQALQPWDDYGKVPAPSWILTSPELLPMFTRKRPDLEAKVLLAPSEDPRVIAVHLEARPASP